MRRIALGLVCLFMFVGIFACEIDDDTIARTITTATSVAFTKILEKNPELTDTFYVYALLNKKVVVDREVDAELCKKILTDVLMTIKDLEEDDRELVLTLFNTIVPLIQLPEKGVLNERQQKFFLAFLSGMLQACETKKAVTPATTTVIEWDV